MGGRSGKRSIKGVIKNMAARKNKKTTGRRTTRSSRRIGKVLEISLPEGEECQGKRQPREKQPGGDKLLKPEMATENF